MVGKLSAGFIALLAIVLILGIALIVGTDLMENFAQIQSNFFAMPLLGNETMSFKVDAQIDKFYVGPNQAPGEEKVILYWKMYGGDAFSLTFPSDAISWRQQCGAGISCIATTDRSVESSADAIFFSMATMRPDDLPNPFRRKPWQRYVFFTLEAAARWQPFTPAADSAFANFFNWTMTFRKDSDIYYPYGEIYDVNEAEPEEARRERLMEKAKRKTRLAAAMSSFCSSDTANRGRIFSELQAYQGIDISGTCFGKNTSICSPPDNATTCRARIERDYFFFLAFENSLCKDYVTEKVFSYLEVDIVPVVLSRNIVVAAGVPNDAFIALDDFMNTTALVRRMEYLSQNLTAYLQYFRWKRYRRSRAITHASFDSTCHLCKVLQKQASMLKHVSEVQKLQRDLANIFAFNQYVYERELEKQPIDMGFCPLCQALYDQTLPPKTIANLTDWWFVQSECRKL